MRTGIVLISTQNPPIYNPRYQGEQGKTGYIKSVSEGGILKRVLRFYTCIPPNLYKYPKIFKKNKPKHQINNHRWHYIRTSVNCRFVLRLFRNCRFVLRLFPSDRRTQFDILSFSSPDLLNTGWCSQDLPFGCLLHHFVSGVFSEQHLNPLANEDSPRIYFLLLVGSFRFWVWNLSFFSLANSCALCMRLSKTNNFVSPPTNCIRLSEGKESNFWFVRSSASWFKSLGTHCKFNSQSLVRNVSDSSIIKMVRGYFVLIHLLTAWALERLSALPFTQHFPLPPEGNRFAHSLTAVSVANISSAAMTLFGSFLMNNYGAHASSNSSENHLPIFPSEVCRKPPTQAPFSVAFASV